MKTLTTKLFATVGLGTALLLGGCEMPPPESTQWGYRGTGMEGLYDPDTLNELDASNIVPEALPAVPAADLSPRTFIKTFRFLVTYRWVSSHV